MRTWKIIHGSTICALTGIVLVGVGIYLGFRCTLPEASVLIGIPMVLGMLTSHAVH
ncbi:MAG: hypothetical protein NT099_08080 [Candidatus Saganbacteria bacterium]|nr:hypothetical protein [Candidatus Saganbacteria bacterium]